MPATTALPQAERYRLGAELGRGGMGRVVEAFDLQLGRTVALKEVLPRGGASIAKRFVREVQLTARLEHPSIVPLYDAGTTVDGRPFYVMRRVSGRPLDQLMAQTTDLGQRLVLLPALLAAVDAVGHAHRRGVIHRDLKPANILVGDLGETVVIDWGLAKVIGEDDDKPGQLIAQASDSLRTQIGSVFGTPGFMAPEQARGEELDPRGDVYALGAILYQLLAGAPPHAGASATEVIAATGSREVTPVDVKAPGAPVDLVAIVGKALAFDAGNRYPDAAALAEDLRRFLAGQLVAAHHYTKRQHVARFARRHRAPLSVAALAMVAVAVLAWVGVHRIVAERDAAQRARLLADSRATEIARANADLQKRGDQLVIAEARGLVDRNPTHAAAVLKDIPDASTRIADARAVAQAAVTRGLAWTMQLPDVLTVYAELSRDGKFLLQVGRDKQLRVWDLDRKKQVVARPYASELHATWAGKQIFVTTERGAPELLDPFAGAIQPFGTAPVHDAAATLAGDRIAYVDAQQAAFVVDVATKAPVALWPGHAVRELAIAPDGSWIALADKTAIAIVDPAGRELATRPVAAMRLIASRFGAVAAQTADGVVLGTLAPNAPAVWTELDFAPFAPGRPIDAEFRGRELDVFITTGKVVAWNGVKLFERTALDGFAFRMVEAAGELLVVPGNDGQLHFSNNLINGALHLPVALDLLKVYASPDASRVIALGRGVLVRFELDALPRTLATSGESALLVDDDTALLWRSDGQAWRWIDLRTRAEVEFAYDARGLSELVDVDPADGRVLGRETGPDTALYMLRKNTKEHRTLVHGAHVWGRLLPHDALVFGVGDGRVFGVGETRNAGQPGAAQPRELAKVDGFVDAITVYGDTGYAAVSTTGELVRGDVVTGALTRAHVQPGTTTAIAAERGGRVLIAEDGKLSVWDTTIVDIAALDQRIVRIAPLQLAGGGRAALLELADHSLVRVAITPGTKPVVVLPASDQAPLISGDGKLIVGQGINNQLTAVELVSPSGQATQASWELPAYYASTGLVAISPSSRRVIQAAFGKLALWQLPLAPGELRTWLDERTDAVTDDNHTLAWSWQLAGPAKPMASPVHPP